MGDDWANGAKQANHADERPEFPWCAGLKEDDRHGEADRREQPSDGHHNEPSPRRRRRFDARAAVVGDDPKPKVRAVAAPKECEIRWREFDWLSHFAPPYSAGERSCHESVSRI